MPSVHIDTVGNTAIIECAGRFVRAEAAIKIRDAVISQASSRAVVLDLTEMHALGGGGLGTLLVLQKWAQDNDIQFQLFNPSGLVRDKLKHAEFEFATLEQMIGMLGDHTFLDRKLGDRKLGECKVGDPQVLPAGRAQSVPDTWPSNQKALLT